jgi:hypothetical protein
MAEKGIGKINRFEESTDEKKKYGVVVKVLRPMAAGSGVWTTLSIKSLHGSNPTGGLLSLLHSLYGKTDTLLHSFDGNG